MFHQEQVSDQKDVKSDSFFQGVPPKTGFIFGVVSGIAATTLVLLILVFSSLVR